MIPETSCKSRCSDREGLSEPSNQARGNERAAIWLLAVLYAIAFLILMGATPSRLYGPSSYHRLQADALLQGHFYLSDSIYAVKFDTAFYHGKVQQIWGLGVAIWLIPFELVGRMIGISPFPDRVPMGIALTLFCYYCIATAIRLKRWSISMVQAIGVVLLFLLSPPLWTLVVKAPQTVYEDGSLYALIVSLSLLLALIRITVFADLRDFFICCALSSLSGLIRPTHLAYGAAGAGLALIFLWLRKVPAIPLIFGAALVLIGNGMLFASNQIRFGSPLEFGHGLSSGSSQWVLISRFINPMKRASLARASMELFGASFFSSGDIREKGDWDLHLFPWQTPFLRWRNWYVTSYDPTLLFFLIAAGVVFARWLFTYCRHAKKKSLLPELTLTLGLGGWAMTCSGLIFGFLLYYQGLCSRYLYDLWPGFVAALLVLWLPSARLAPRLAPFILVIWLVGEIFRGDCRLPKLPHLTWEEAPTVLNPDASPILENFDGYYEFGNHPSDSQYSLISNWWHRNTGKAGYVVMAPVDHPAFVEIRVGRRIRPVSGAATGREDVYQAQIDGTSLRLLETIPDGPDTCKVRFDVPRKIRERSEDALLFLCFVNQGDLYDLQSERILYSIRWRLPSAARIAAKTLRSDDLAKRKVIF